MRMDMEVCIIYIPFYQISQFDTFFGELGKF